MSDQDLYVIEFCITMANEYPELPRLQLRDTLSKLMKLSQKHHRLQEKACNEDVPEGHDEKCEKAICELCSELPGCKPIFGGDPRGCTVKLQVRSGATNDFGREGICVPQGR